MNANRLGEAVTRLESDAPELRALLVVRNGKLVLEEYYGGAQVNTPLNTKSVCKSIVSALVGIAIQRGLLSGADQYLEELLPEYLRSADNDGKRRIKLKHLLTMTAGLEWIENGPVTFQWVRSDDPVRFAMGLNMTSEPGETFTYNTSLSHLLAVCVAKTSRVSLRVFAETHLFRPIGARVHRWDTLPPGIEFGGSELHMTARDIARFGFLYLNGGHWEGRQIVPRSWVDESIRVHSEGDAFLGCYGYLWWLGREEDHATFFASGAHGQIIYVVPSLDLLVIVCSSTDGTLHHVRPYMTEFVAAVEK